MGAEFSISVRAYEANRDWPVIQQWLTERGLGAADNRALPELGRVAELSIAGEVQTLVAAAWLYADPSCNLAFLHNLITRPRTSLKIFRRALKALIESLSEEAVRRGYEHLCSQTRTGGLLRESVRQGFHVSDERLHKSIYKPLNS